MEMDVFVPGQPTVAFGLVGVEVVEDHVDFAVGMLGYDAVHEVEKLHTAATFVMIALHQPGGHLQSRKQGGCAMPLVVMLKARERFAVGQFQPTLSPFQGLDVRFFVDAQHQSMFRRVQIKPDHIGGFLCKARIGGNPPTVTPFQRNSMFAQNTPNLIVGNILQRRCQQGAIPTRIAFGRRLIQLGQNATFALQVVGRWFAWPRCILQPLHPVAQKTTAPFARRGWPRLHVRRDLLVAGPRSCPQNHAGSKHIPPRTGCATHHQLQITLLFRRKRNAAGLHA